MISKYMSEIEDLRTKLCESENLCEQLRKENTKVKRLSANLTGANMPWLANNSFNNAHDESGFSVQELIEMAKKDPSSYYDDTISSKLRVARKKKFALQEEKRVQEEIDLQSYLNRLILEDKDRKMNKLREENESYDEASGEIAKLEEESDKSVAELNNLFAKVDERRQTRDVPDYLCGKISFEILKDPVITPSGITYDRKDIVEHLERVGHFDPVTRTKLTQDMLVPNYAMKEVVDDFVSSNEWSLYY